jgi:hypothetical protein
MTKRTSRVAWGLAAVLAVVVTAGASVLLVSYQNHLPEEERWVTLLPRSKWGFGIQLESGHLWSGFGPSGWELGYEAIVERRKLGFFAVRVK